MYLAKSVVHLEKGDFDSGDLLTKSNALQHGWCDEGDDKVARGSVSPGGFRAQWYTYFIQFALALIDVPAIPCQPQRILPEWTNGC